MKPRWEEGEFVFCDRQAAARVIRRGKPTAPRALLEAAYDPFECLAQNSGVGRPRAHLGFPEVRSWRVAGFRNYLVFYRKIPGEVQIWRVLHGARDLERFFAVSGGMAARDERM